MKNYYIHNGENQEGPFSFEELKSKTINSKTMVWFEGLENWVKALDLEELKPLIKTSPPPFERKGVIEETFDKTRKAFTTDPINHFENKIKNSSSKNTFKWMISIFAVLGALFSLFYFYEKSPLSNPKIEDTILIEKTLTKYSYYSTYQYNNCHNNSKNYCISNIIVKLNFLSKNGKILASENIIIDCTITPGADEELIVESKYAPKVTEFIEWKIVDAQFKKIQ